MKRYHVFATFAALAIVSVVIWRLVHPSGKIGIELLTGWVSYLLRVVPRVVPRVTVRWDGIALTVSCLLGLALLVHYFGRWLHRESSANETKAQRRWRPRWSTAIMLVVIMMFVAGIAMVGVCHQTIWLVSDDESLFESVERADSYTYGSSRMNLKYMGLGFATCYDANNRLVASGRVNEFGEMSNSWMTEILPYMNYVTDEIDPDVPWSHPHNAKAFSSVIPEYVNRELPRAPVRDRDGYALTHYSGNRHVLRPNRPAQLSDFKGETSNTILAGEVNDAFVPWAYPGNVRDPALGINKTARGFGGRPGARGAAFLMVSGEVRFVNDNVDQDVMRALSREE